MKQICPTCQYIGKSKFTPFETYKIPLGGFLIGWGVYMMSFVDYQNFIAEYQIINLLVGCISFILIGGFLLYNNQEINSDLCPKCCNGHMLKINSKKANKFIEENSIQL